MNDFGYSQGDSFLTSPGQGALEWDGNGTSPLSIHIPRAVMNEIVIHAVEGLSKDYPGGTQSEVREVLGILVGSSVPVPCYTKDPLRYMVIVQAMIPIEIRPNHREDYCEYSSKDKAIVSNIIDRKDLHGLMEVGWFHTHPRHPLFLSPPDQDLMNADFPLPNQFALVVQPLQAKAGIFVWDRGRLDFSEDDLVQRGGAISIFDYYNPQLWVDLQKRIEQLEQAPNSDPHRLANDPTQRLPQPKAAEDLTLDNPASTIDVTLSPAQQQSANSPTTRSASEYAKDDLHDFTLIPNKSQRESRPRQEPALSAPPAYDRKLFVTRAAGMLFLLLLGAFLGYIAFAPKVRPKTRKAPVRMPHNPGQNRGVTQAATKEVCFTFEPKKTQASSSRSLRRKARNLQKCLESALKKLGGGCVAQKQGWYAHHSRGRRYVRYMSELRWTSQLWYSTPQCAQKVTQAVLDVKQTKRYCQGLDRLYNKGACTTFLHSIRSKCSHKDPSCFNKLVAIRRSPQSTRKPSGKPACWLLHIMIERSQGEQKHVIKQHKWTIIKQAKRAIKKQMTRKNIIDLQCKERQFVTGAKVECELHYKLNKQSTKKAERLSEVTARGVHVPPYEFKVIGSICDDED